MKSSTLLGSALSVLLLFSVISYSRTFVRQQDPKPVQQTAQPSNPQTSAALATSETAPAAKESTVAVPATGESGASAAAVAGPSAEKAVETVAAPAQTYTATAYSLRGRTASGKPVARGLIAADPRFLPLGTRVRIEAGSFSGEYVVADTGGAVRGRRVDIWTPTAREALQFGRRAVKLTVLEFGGKRAETPLVRPRIVNPVTSSSAVTQQTTKQEK